MLSFLLVILLTNNSVSYTERPDMGIFMSEWQSLYKSKAGERGIFSREAANNLRPERREESDFGTNPCSEIVLRNKQFCNLSEVVVRPNVTTKLWATIRTLPCLPYWVNLKIR